MTDIAAAVSADIRQLEPKNELDPRYESPPLLSRILNATTISAIQGANASGNWYKGWQQWFSPPGFKGPDIVKTYDVKANLPVDIFFPSSYDQTSPLTLPTLFTIHGGGFCIGTPADDTRWNRAFADTHNTLVIALNYSKAPWSPFPGPVHDVACLFLSAASDPSLPIDKSRVAISGFSAGGNLALALCQLPTVRSHPAAPKAVVPIYPPVDVSRTPASKRRQYKVDTRLAGLRGAKKDWVLPIAGVFDWSYISPGINLRHPLLSTFYAKREDLPAQVFFVAAELDFLAEEAHQMALRLAGRERDASYGEIPGRPEASGKVGELELGDERFAWEEKDVRWLLVPDVVHAFDYHVGAEISGDEEATRDAEAKTEKYIRLVGEWLFTKVWA
ncbi:related to triacylglycerol lipase [Cephalotrichum gorgonifer]|uniref:Related to triacylglycerol lipase n=1 Tax=Cephalotrichum gorgonifer TaxID=2041049 RepID=A0AAE8N4X9_9PEZI|nr:related to triacylglycerol lipase [Cephalotrichum gorgonifer]